VAEAKGKKVFLFLRIAVVVGGIIWGVVWISRDVGWANLAETFRRINPSILALALAIFVLAQVLIGLRWWLLLRSQSIFIAFWAAVKLYFLGWFYNNFMPGSVGGDLLRAWYVTKHAHKKFEAVLSVFVDRAIGLLSTLAIAVFFYWLFLRGEGIVITSAGRDGFTGYVLQYKEAVGWVLATIAVIFCLLLLHSRSRGMLAGIWSSILMHGVKMIEKFKNALILYCRRPLTILAAFGLTVFLQLMTITGFWLLGMNLGITVSIKYYFVFFTLVWVLGAVPVSIGGAVVVEGFLIYMFIHFAGVDKDAASVLALSQRVVWMLASLPGAVIHLVGAHLPREFSVDYNKPVN